MKPHAKKGGKNMGPSLSSPGNEAAGKAQGGPSGSTSAERILQLCAAKGSPVNFKFPYFYR